MNTETQKETEDPRVVAVVEQAPYTGGWRYPQYFYSMKAAKETLYRGREAYPSYGWRLTEIKDGRRV